MIRRSPLRRRSRKAIRDSVLDALCREVVFRRDGFKCAKSGKTDNLQWAHVYSRRYKSLRWAPENSLCLNAGEHLAAHHRPLEFAAWFEATYPERAAWLRLRMQTASKIDKAATRLWLESQLKGVA